MNALNSFRKLIHQRIPVPLVTCSLVLAMSGGYRQPLMASDLQVIVQAADPGTATQAVLHEGGTVVRDLSLINAVAASVPADRVDAIRTSSGVTAVWPDVGVESTDTADPGVLYSPAEGAEGYPASFDVTKVSSCDGNRDNMDYIPRLDLSPHIYQTYSFKPAVDPLHLPVSVKVSFLFKEKSLNQAQLQVFQNSTRTWYAFGIDTLRSNDAMIDSTFDLSSVLTTVDDFANVEIRFLASRNEAGEKAEVDCVQLRMDSRLVQITSGSENKPAGFDLKKVSYLDNDREPLDYFPAGNINPHTYQSYTFKTTVDPTNLPGLIDLNFMFKEKSLNHAQLQVYQRSTHIWHTFDIDTLSTDDRMIYTLLDLTDVLQVPEDFTRIEVRFMISRMAGGEKAEVELVSLRLAELIGDTMTRDVTAAFEAINASAVWATGATGAGIGVAVLDSGVKKYHELEQDGLNQKTGLSNGWNAIDEKNDGRRDKNGHGTLVASIISNEERNAEGKYYGVSPDSTIIPIQVLDQYGRGSYSQVIAGIQWAVEHRDDYNIRVINLSLSAPVRSPYWGDPLNLAVMKAWQSGIVVVVAAGNNGPDPMTIGVPGNNPYVITVGAVTDAYTPSDLSDDYIPSFSAAGPTFEGFVKPDVVAPGGHIVGLMSEKCELARIHPNNKLDKDYYTLTGTSMSAAQVSGVIALMLQHNPRLTPDQVKYRLLASALPAVTPDGKPAFSVWQQGTGRVNAYQAVFGKYTGAANQGLDINADLLGTQHFVGFTQWDPAENQFYLVDGNGVAWSEAYTWGGGVAWSEAYTWGGGVAWSEAYTLGGGVAWSEAFALGGGVAWSEYYALGGGVAWSEGVPWGEASASLVSWVGDE